MMNRAGGVDCNEIPQGFLSYLWKGWQLTPRMAEAVDIHGAIIGSKLL